MSLNSPDVRGHLRSRVLFLVISLSLWTHIGIAEAAPVTFAFDATITEVFPGVPFNFPLTYQVGDSITGKFTFEPEQAPPNAFKFESLQPYDLKLEISGTVLTSPGYGIRVADEVYFSHAPWNVADVINVGSFLDGDITIPPPVLTLPGSVPFRFRVTLELIGADNPISDPDITSDPSLWNSFDSERTINVGFSASTPGSTGSVAFKAIVGEMLLVPEPSGALLVISFMAHRSIAFRRKNAECVQRQVRRDTHQSTLAIAQRDDLGRP